MRKCLLLITFLLLSCSENIYYNKTAQHISIEILNKPDTILAGSNVLFLAAINPSPDAVKKKYWTVDSRAGEILSLSFESKHFDLFEESGVYNVGFYAIDFLGDTLSSNLTISVANKPICEYFELDYIFGSPCFKWSCHDLDGDKLTYDFKLKTIARTLMEDSLLLGIPLPAEPWEASLIAANSYGFKDTIYLEAP